MPTKTDAIVAQDKATAQILRKVLDGKVRKLRLYAGHWKAVQDILYKWKTETTTYLDCLNALKRVHPEVGPQCDAANRKVSLLNSAISIAMFEHDDLRLGTKCDRRHDGPGGPLAHGVEG